MSGPYPPETDGLEDGCDSADQQRRKGGPSYVGIRLPGNPGYYDNRQDHRSNNQHCCLKAGANGYRVGWNIVRFVADVLVYM